MEKIVTLENKSITVKKLPIKKYADLVKQIQNLPKVFATVNGKTSEEIVTLLPNLVETSLDDVVSIIANAVDMPKAEVEELGFSEVTSLFIAVIEVNQYAEAIEKLKKAFGQQSKIS